MDERRIIGNAIRIRRDESRLSLAELADQLPISKSTLHRVEKGQADINDFVLKKIDSILMTSGELFRLRDSIRGRPLTPSHSKHVEVMEAGHRWAAELAGVVWVHVEELGGADHSGYLTLKWGPWSYRTDWNGQEVILEDFKVADDVSVAFAIRLSHLSTVTFGTGPVDAGSARFIDLRNQWTNDRVSASKVRPDPP